MLDITHESNYALLSVFRVGEEDFYIVRTKGGVCTLGEDEYKRFWGANHPDHWKKKIA